MAANWQPNPVLSQLILLTIFHITHSFSQSSSPQNIQTFYPFYPPKPPPLPRVVLPPPPRSYDPPYIPPPTTFILPPPPSPRSSRAAAVGTAIGVTAATTLVLSGLVFFLVIRHSRRKREGGSAAGTNGGSNPGGGGHLQIDNFRRFSGDIKGLIVDENGLDVLYWRNLQEGGDRTSFKKKYYSNLKDEQRDEERKTVGDKVMADKSPRPNVPLLRGRSSTSQSPIWGEKEAPSVTNGMRMQNAAQTLGLVSSSEASKGKRPAPEYPPQAFKAVPRETLAAPLPPPFVPHNKSNALPAPSRWPASSLDSHGSMGTVSSIGEGSSTNVNPEVQHSMELNKLNSGSLTYDGDLMEALFGFVATNKKSPKTDSKSSAKLGPPPQIFLLDKHRSQSISNVLKSLVISRVEIINALIEGHGLNSDTIEKLASIAPAEEEVQKILAFDGDPTRLADAESFMYYILKAIPSAFVCCNAMLFRSNYDTEVSFIKESLNSLESACKELKAKGIIFKLLEAVLKAGSRLQTRGNAQAFNLKSLIKLSSVKSSDGKTTLLQFVIQEVVRAEGKRCVSNKNRGLNRATSSNSEIQIYDQSMERDNREKEYMMLGLPVIGGQSVGFPNVKKAATLNYDILVQKISALAAELWEIRKTMAQCRAEGGFAQTMDGFLDTAELEIKVLKEEQIRVMELVKKTADYYQAGNSKMKEANSLQLFVIVKEFLRMVDQICVEIASNVQKREPVSPVAGSSSPRSPRVFRFPKLPPDFVSDDSNSDAGEPDGGSEMR